MELNSRIFLVKLRPYMNNAVIDAYDVSGLQVFKQNDLITDIMVLGLVF
jgi:hypothetical protein